MIYTHKERTSVRYSPADAAATVRRIIADRGIKWLSSSDETTLAIWATDRRVSLTTEQLNRMVAQVL